MHTSRLNDIFEKDSCLTPELISRYVDGKADKEIKHYVEKHLVDCELCSLAVEGAMSVPLTNANVNELYEKIDNNYKTGKKKVKSQRPMTFYAAIIAAMALVAYFIVKKDPKSHVVSKTELYELVPTEKPAVKKELTPAEINTLVEQKKETKVGTPPEIPVINKADNIDNLKRKELFLQPYSSISASDQLPIRSVPTSDEVIYLHNCKVANIRKLYFKSTAEVNILRNVPAPNEKKYSVNESDEKSESAISILDVGLDYFSREKYGEAYTELQLLLENNDKDINALFYSGLCLFHLGDIKDAKLRLAKLNKDNYFGEEANWYFALCLLKENNLKEAEIKLHDIMKANGFYSIQAEKKLDELKGK